MVLSAVELVVGVGEPSRCVVWMHGLGADGNDFPPIVPHLGLGDEPATRFVFPHAPSIPVSLNMGMVMPAWYDIRDLDLRNRHDEDGIRKSANAIEALLRQQEERGIRPERTVVAGFSQGGAMALHVGLRYPQRLAGILGLSTYLVLDDVLETEVRDANRQTPVFLGHGSFDPMVALARGEAARDRLAGAGYDVAWHVYPMQHQVVLEEIADIGTWLRQVL